MFLGNLKSFNPINCYLKDGKEKDLPFQREIMTSLGMRINKKKTKRRENQKIQKFLADFLNFQNKFILPV